jgi:type 1 glutamine amidotransferase
MKRRYVLSLAVIAAFLGLCTLLNTQAVAQEVKPAKVLLFTRSQGFEHEPAKRLDDGTTGAGRLLKKYFEGKNIELVETQDGGVFDGDIDQYDAYIFYTSGNLQDARGSKNDTAKPMTEAGLRKMIAAVQKGKGFVGIHSATDTHCNLKDDEGVDLYTKFVGARFTSHGEQQEAKLTVVEPTAFPSLKDEKQLTLRDEWYAMNQFNKDMHVILIQETEGMRGRDYQRPPFPATWIRKEGEGRMLYTSLGHDNRYFDIELKWIGNFVECVIKRFDVDMTPNIEKVTPGFAQMPQ